MLKPSVQVHNMDGILVAEFWDCLRLDPAPVLDLRTHYEAHLQRHGRPELVVDLNGVGYAGSAALGNFVALHRIVRQKGGRILFCNVEPTVAEVFRASKLESLFDFTTDRDTALRAIRERSTTDKVDRKSADGDLLGQHRPKPSPRQGLTPLRRRNRDTGSA
jgi:anti-anti-sigma factor